MDVKDIKRVLELAKVGHEEGKQPQSESDHAAIEAVEIWLREIGALPPR